MVERLEGFCKEDDWRRAYNEINEFERQLIQGLEENNIFRTLAHTINTNSGSRIIPLATDTGSASWIEEGAAIQESDMSFAQETLSAYKLGCMIKVSNELLNDSAFNIAAHIAQRFGVRFGNAEEDAFINGTGQKWITYQLTAINFITE